MFPTQTRDHYVSHPRAVTTTASEKIRRRISQRNQAADGGRRTTTAGDKRRDKGGVRGGGGAVVIKNSIVRSTLGSCCGRMTDPITHNQPITPGRPGPHHAKTGSRQNRRRVMFFGTTSCSSTPSIHTPPVHPKPQAPSDPSVRVIGRRRQRRRLRRRRRR